VHNSAKINHTTDGKQAYEISTENSAKVDDEEEILAGATDTKQVNMDLCHKSKKMTELHEN
jgi:hypothetical protein